MAIAPLPHSLAPRGHVRLRGQRQAHGGFVGLWPSSHASCMQRLGPDASPVVRSALFRKAPPPPPAFWQQPSTWAIAIACVGVLLAARFLVRRLRPQSPAASKMSVADMYFQLEKSAGVKTEVQPQTNTSVPMAPLPPLTAAPKIPAPAPLPPATAPTSLPKPDEQSEASSSPLPEVPATTTASTQTPPAPPTPPSVPPPPAAAPAAAAPAEAAAAPAQSEDAKAKEEKGFGWLLNRNKTSEVPSLAALLSQTDEEGSSRPPVKFLRAVASELCLDAPEGVFDGVEGLTVVPAAVPQATRTALLHAAVKSEAEKLQSKDCAEGVLSVAKSMVCELVDRAAGLKDKKLQTDALDKLVLFAVSCESILAELAPDVEAGRPVYEGSIRYKTLESLYDSYLDGAVDEMQQTTAAMFSSMMGGEDKMTESVEQMTARAEQAEKARATLAAIFKISEGKAEKIMEKKMKGATEQAQKDLMSGLMSGGS